MASRGRTPPGGSERRQHERSPCMLDASFRRIGGGGPLLLDETYVKCKAADISEGGLLLETDTYVAEGERLEVFVKLEDGSKTIAGEVEAVRSEKKFGKFRIGVKFLKKETF